MTPYIVEYVTLVRRERKSKRVVAKTPEKALAAIPNDCGGPNALWLDREGLPDDLPGGLVWHFRTGWIARLGGGRRLPEWAEDLPQYGPGVLKSYLDSNPDSGVHVEGGVATLGRTADNGQRQNQVAIILLQHVIELVREGRVHCVPVCFQSRWTYRQGACPNGGVAFPDCVPTDPRAPVTGPDASAVLGRKPLYV